MFNAYSLPTLVCNQAAIEKLDAEIRSLTTRLCLLKSERNNLSITYILPAEILGEIFTIVQEQCGYDHDRGSSRKGGFARCTWLSMTCVSRHWREVALGCPQLWCNIRSSAMPLPIIQTFLARSRGANISVNFTTPWSPVGPESPYYQQLQPCGVEDILAEAFRIEKLDFSLQDSHFAEMLPQLISTPVPKLRSLYICSPGYRTIPDDIFQATAPQLRSLSLVQCRFNLNSPFLTPNLTSLYISFCPAGSTILWLNALQQTPQLSYLNLTSSFTDETYTPISKGFGMVPLLQLSRLVIEGSLFDSDLDFLSHITFHSQTSLNFTSNIRESQIQRPTPPLAALLQVHGKAYCDHDTSETKVTTIKLEQRGDEGQLRNIQLDAHTGDQPYLVAYIDIAGPCPAWNEAPMDDIALLPISLLNLFVADCDVKEESWKVLSDRAPHLQEISVSHLAVQPFLLALGAGDIDTLDPNGEWRGLSSYLGGMEAEGQGLKGVEDNLFGPTHRLFKSLKTIDLADPEPLQFKEDIMNALSVRRLTGLPVETVRLSRWAHVDEEFWFDLKGLVREVDYTRPATPSPDLGFAY
ncbi:hypothetical protein BDN72DRAFT_844727 [Pluteus cervinus]|uniref:Uncharacterized protein n=1 Tax=Pluteus cervinus TaxID=181527 RepID=A0ACD3AKH8_9AGAR|nr:hypothetical protein BDN72DRAFT_844727 [Pluteus cervinus]